MSESDAGRVREAKIEWLFEDGPGEAVPRPQRIARFVAALDDVDSVVAEEASAGLISRYGAESLEALLSAAPAFARFGRLSAIKVFDAIGDPRAAEVVTPWLGSDDAVVRAWTAELLGSLRATDAVPALDEAWKRTKQSNVPPDESEPVAIRQALTALGARHPVVPDTAANLSERDESIGQFWKLGDLEDVLKALYDTAQVVLTIRLDRQPEQAESPAPQNQ